MAAQPGRTEQAIDSDPHFHPVTWTVAITDFYSLLAEIDEAELDEEMLSEVFATVLSDEQIDELERRCHGELPQLVYGVVSELAVGDGPELVIAGVQEALAKEGITLVFQGLAHVLPGRMRKGTPPQPPRD